MTRAAACRMLAVLVSAVLLLPGCALSTTDQEPSASAERALADAYRERRSGMQVSGEGVVIRVLSDDNDGSRHQRFILELAGGQTLLIAHNIDVAPRIESLQIGDTVEFNGEYEFNGQGGVIHWTHHDPEGRHAPGWLKHDGTAYQ